MGSKNHIVPFWLAMVGVIFIVLVVVVAGGYYFIVAPSSQADEGLKQLAKQYDPEIKAIHQKKADAYVSGTFYYEDPRNGLCFLASMDQPISQVECTKAEMVGEDFVHAHNPDDK